MYYLKDNKKNKFFIFLVCFYLLIYRNIGFFISPTFFADEGTFFISRAYKLGLKSFLLSHGGYYQFFQNLASYIAVNFFEIEYSPYFTSFCGIAILLIPVSIFLFGNSVFEFTFLQRSILSIFSIVILEAGFSYNITNSHFVLALATGLILFERQNNRNVNFLYNLIMLISCFSGVIPLILFPAFLYRYIFIDKNRNLKIQIAILILGIIFQSYFFVGSFFNNDIYVTSVRFNMPSVDYFLFQFFLQFLVGGSFIHHPELNRVLSLLSLICYIYLTYKYLKTNKFVALLSINVFVLSFVCQILSQGMVGGNRYVYVSNIYFMMLLLYGVSHSEYTDFLKWLIIVMIVIPFLNYKPIFDKMINEKKITWKDEVMKWRNNENYKPLIYFYVEDSLKQWRVDLKK